MLENAIVYEQPLNELIRVCLRLEQLFFQLEHQINDTTPMGTRFVVASIINILQILDRPDLKAKLAKELSQHASNLSRLEKTPNIDHEILSKLLQQLDNLMRCFIDTSGKIGQHLRDIELFNNLRLHLAMPGGGCSFDIPVYHYWLQQPKEIRQQSILNWSAEFENIRTAIFLILRLVREATKVVEKNADHGFYQELLDPQLNLKLIRVAIHQQLPAFPEISVGRHFLSIRFFPP